MKYIAQEETRFDAHGHWNTRHTVSMSLEEALSLMELIDKAYPKAFNHEKGGKWRFGKVNYNELPDIHLQSIVEVLEQILDKDP
jgi:hypothetical protein